MYACILGYDDKLLMCENVSLVFSVLLLTKGIYVLLLLQYGSISVYVLLSVSTGIHLSWEG